MNTIAFMEHWNLHGSTEGNHKTLVDEAGEFVCYVCPVCGRPEPSAATCNMGTFQPDYCRCGA